jgi:peptide/nickel transport system substrate-binding protein/oligopeptide transport system substrate-binding protein
LLVALGITVKIDDIDINKLFQEIPAATNNAKGLQMWKVDWIADYPDSQDFMTLQFDKGLPNNNMNYGQNMSSDAATQQQMQKLLEQADINPDAASRAQQYYQAEQQAINDVAWLPIYQNAIDYVLKPCIVGQVDNAEGLTPPDDWGSIYKTTASSCANVSQYQ